MVAAPVTELTIVNTEVEIPSIEIIPFTTASSGDYYDCKLLNKVDGAFACQSTTDGTDIQVSWSRQSNGVYRITLTLETGSVVTGFLTIFGSL
jgi:hypothetical protein